MITKLYPATTEDAARLRAELAAMGVKKARVRVMKYGAARLVLNSVADRDAARENLERLDRPADGRASSRRRKHRLRIV